MKRNTCNKNRHYHTIAVTSEIILSLKEWGRMGESYNDVISRLLKIASSVNLHASVGEKKEDGL